MDVFVRMNDAAGLGHVLLLSGLIVCSVWWSRVSVPRWRGRERGEAVNVTKKGKMKGRPLIPVSRSNNGDVMGGSL